MGWSEISGIIKLTFQKYGKNLMHGIYYDIHLECAKMNASIVFQGFNYNSKIAL